MEQILKARRIKMESRQLCDFQGEGHNQIIEKDKYAYQVVGDETVLAQGLYHGSLCYNLAKAKYEEELKKIKGEENA